MKVSVKVVRGVQVSKLADLDFGTIRQHSGSHEIKATDASAARFVIQGEPGANVFVKLNDSVVLNSKTGSALTMKTVKPAYSTDAGMQDRFFSSAEGGTAKLCEKSGKLFVNLGGEIDADQADPGSYSGTYTAVVEYM